MSKDIVPNSAKLFFKSLILATFCFSTATAGENHHEHHDHESHEAHTHGHANMNLFWEGEELFIELESPAINLLGFESSPQTEQQKNTVKQVAEALNQPNELFNTGQLGCEVDEVLLEMPNFHDHGHDEKSHADITAGYTFLCPETNKKKVQVKLFQQYNRLENIAVQWITDKKQGAASLTPKQTEVILD